MKRIQLNFKKSVLAVALSIALGSALVQAENEAAIDIGISSLSYTAGSEDRLTLSVAGPDMEVVSVSANSSIYWYLTTDLSDGTYRYELNVTAPGIDGEEENSSSKRMHGIFEVINGTIDLSPASESFDDGNDPTSHCLKRWQSRFWTH